MIKYVTEIAINDEIAYVCDSGFIYYDDCKTKKLSRKKRLLLASVLKDLSEQFKTDNYTYYMLEIPKFWEKCHKIHKEEK